MITIVISSPSSWLTEPNDLRLVSSVWWPIPVRPSSWFDDDQLAASDRYHRPLASAAGARAIARVGGLLLVAAVCRTYLGVSDPKFVRFFVGVVLLTLVWWLPATAVDWWFDRCHQPRFGTPALPATQLAVGSMVSGFATLLVLASGGGTMLVILDLGGWLPWLVGCPIIVAGLIGLLLARQSCAFVASSGGTLERLDESTEERFRALARRAAIEPDQILFGRLPEMVDDGLNALTTSMPRSHDGARQQVAVTSEVLRAEPEVQRLLVAHELGHLQHGHIGGMAAVALIELFTVAAVTTLALVSPMPGFRLVSTGDPRGLAELVALLWVLSGMTGLASAWVERTQERQADAAAIEIAKPVSLQAVRSIHGTTRADLAPGLMGRLWSSHPTPGERLQRASLLLGLTD